MTTAPPGPAPVRGVYERRESWRQLWRPRSCRSMPLRPVLVRRSISTSINGELIVGYQGWFGCRDEFGSGLFHWERKGRPTVDMLPDLSDIAAEDTCPSGWTDVTGASVQVFSSKNPRVVERHFDWMERYGLDTAAVQRFVGMIRGGDGRRFTDTVLDNIRKAAEAHGRTFFIMYDLSDTTVDDLEVVSQDWQRLNRSGMTTSSAYQSHRGHPLIALWGLGFDGRALPPAWAAKLISRLRVELGGATIMLGVPTYWRSGTHDASADPAWRDIYRSVDVISPWTVGRYSDGAGIDAYRRQVMEPDIAWARGMLWRYLPVVFPGSAWANLMTERGNTRQAIRNEIPRRCGDFIRHQLNNTVESGSHAVYVAMFDEVNEGTAIFKVRPHSPPTPGVGPFLALDADGCDLPSDYYLRVAGEAAVRLRAKWARDRLDDPNAASPRHHE